MYKIIGGDQREYGPVDFNSVLDWIRQGRANAQTLVQKDGGAWAPLGSLPEFAEALAAQAAATPAGGGTLPPPPVPDAGGDRRAALRAVQGPATGLVVYGALCLLTSVWGIVQALVFRNSMLAQQQEQLGQLPPEAREMLEPFLEAMTNPAIAVGSSLLGVLLSVLILYGGLRMRRLESFALVVTAAVLALLPCNCPCCCLGLPIGIWALAVVLKPDVKAAFS